MRFSVILRTAARFLVPRGHNETGGGFIGGLVAGISFALYGISYGTESSRAALRVAPQQLMAVGLGIAVLSGLLPLVGGGAFLEGLWVTWGGIKLGTPVLFDVGVYLLVIGITLVIVYELDDHNPGLFPLSATSG